MGGAGMSDLFMERSAVISDCQRYRYLLRRRWDSGLAQVLFIMLNPSTADAEEDDATIRSCIRLTRSWGGGGIEVVNLFGWRATDPAQLQEQMDPIGELNDAMANAAIERCGAAICAWGAHPMANGRAEHMLRFVRERRLVALCLGVTKAGMPKHPLYIPTKTTPVVLHDRPAWAGEAAR